jgi:SAM-dependent methyltransferase
MANNKSHYYDGIIYDKFIAPNQDYLFRLIKSIIPKESTVLDIGCGTGRLAFQLSDKCESIVGLDLSQRNIRRALKILKKSGIDNIDFFHQSVEDFAKNYSSKFDYAVTTYVLHEIPESERLPFIEAMKKVADKLILGDYLIPRPKGYHFYLTEIIEFIAGREHYAGFKSFERNGGLRDLVEKANLKIIKEIKGKPVTAHIIVAE